MRSPCEHDLQQHAKALRRLARSLVGDQHADDLLQDATLQLLTAPTPVRSLRGFLHRVLTGLAAKHHRSERRRRAREAAVFVRESPQTPDWIAEHRETLRRLDAALLALPEPLLGTLLLRFFEDLPPNAIAQRTGAPLPTVRSRIARGLELLRARMQDQDADWRPALAAAFGLPHGAVAVASIATTMITGVLLMGSGVKLASGAAAVAAATVACFWFLQAPPSLPEAHQTALEAPIAAAAEVASPQGEDATVPTLDRREVASAVTEAPAGPLTTLRGRAVDELGNPIARADAELSGLCFEGARKQTWLLAHDVPDTIRDTAITAADGSFAFTFWPPPPFAFHLRLKAPGHATIQNAWSELTPGITVDLGDVVMPPGTLLLGRVLDAAGDPVANTQIMFTGSQRQTDGPHPVASAATITAVDGRFACGTTLPAGDYKAEVRLRELVVPKHVEITGAAEQHVDFTVARAEATPTLSGFLVDDAGNPMAQVMVMPVPMQDGTGVVTASDARGHFELRRPPAGSPDEIALHLSRFDLEAVLTKERFAWGRSDVRIVLPHGLELELLVVDAEHGSPVEDYAAYVLPAQGGGDSREYELRTHGHHDGGRAVIHGLRRGKNVVMVLPRSDALACSAFVPIDIADPGLVRQTVTLPAKAQRLLRVQTADGTPVAGAVVQLTDRLGVPATAPAMLLPIHEWGRTTAPKALLLATSATDAAGEVMLRGPSDRTLAVQLPGPAFVPVVTEVNLELQAPLIVTVHSGATLRAHLEPKAVLAELRRLAGLPPEGTVGANNRSRLPRLVVSRGEGADREAYPDDQHDLRAADDGSFLLTGIPAGHWRIEVECYRQVTSYAGVTQWEPGGSVDLREGETTDLRIDLSDLMPGRLDGLALHNDAPLTNTDLILQRQTRTGQDSANVTTDSAGRFHAQIRSGTYALTWQRPSGASWNLATFAESAVVTRGQDTMQTFHLQSAPIRIRLLDATGEPAAKVAIELRDAAGDSRRWLPPTDADGRTEADVELDPFAAFVLPKRLQDPAAMLAFRRQHLGERDPLAALRLRLGEVTPRIGASSEITLRLPIGWDR